MRECFETTMRTFVKRFPKRKWFVVSNSLWKFAAKKFHGLSPFPRRIRDPSREGGN